MIEQVKSLYQSVASQNILVFYNGAISNEMVMQLGDILEKKQTLSGKMKRLFSIFIEMSQNIMRYSIHREHLDGADEPTGVGMVLVVEHADAYLISAANLVEQPDVKIIFEQIDYVNSLDKDALKALFLERRKMPPPPGSKGAGLGLIDMARKSDKPLEYMSWPSKEKGKVFFSIMATVLRVKEAQV
jgi:hypothetical protein